MPDLYFITTNSWGKKILGHLCLLIAFIRRQNILFFGIFLIPKKIILQLGVKCLPKLGSSPLLETKRRSLSSLMITFQKDVS